LKKPSRIGFKLFQNHSSPSTVLLFQTPVQVPELPGGVIFLKESRKTTENSEDAKRCEICIPLPVPVPELSEVLETFRSASSTKLKARKSIIIFSRHRRNNKIRKNRYNRRHCFHKDCCYLTSNPRAFLHL